MRIVNRWGNLVFDTNDPEILWDGMNKYTNTPAPDGVYYYTCLVQQISVTGIIETSIKGTVHILGTNTSQTPNN